MSATSWRVLMLAGLVAGGGLAAAPLENSAMAGATSDSLAGAACKVDFVMRNDLPRGDCDETLIDRCENNIAVAVGESQVRTRIGVWTTLKQKCPYEYYRMKGGEATRFVCELVQACSARRRYRLLVRLFGKTSPLHTEERWLYFPDSSSFTRNTTNDLGDVSRIFR